MEKEKIIIDMGLSVKKVKLHEDMSEETPCFSADVYQGGKLIAHARNSGHGGCNDYSPAKGVEHKDIGFLMALEVDCYVMELVEQYNYVTKNQNKGLVLREINPDSILSPQLMVATLIGSRTMGNQKKSPTYNIWLERQRKSLKEQGYEIINRNL